MILSELLRLHRGFFFVINLLSQTKSRPNSRPCGSLHEVKEYEKIIRRMLYYFGYYLLL